MRRSLEFGFGAGLAPLPPSGEAPSAHLPILECGDPLVPLKGLERRGLFTQPAYFDLGIPGAEETLRVREAVRDRLLRAAADLPPGIALCVFDGFRPIAVQRWLWDEFTGRTRRRYPEWDEATLRTYVGQFVATPNPDPTRPPPHRTGGAVDLYLVEAATGEPLPMGTAPDEACARAETRWFERRPRAPLTQNRRLLFHALAAAGFVNYDAEWWHYEYGTRRWAVQSGADAALYGDAETLFWEI